jgi:PknH-like extracellular domain
MSLRVKVSAIAITAAACVVFAPAAMASSHGPIQVTGKQLRSALLPASEFVAGYVASNIADSGSKLEHLTRYRVPSMSCRNFWTFAGVVQGFGETAFATDLVDNKAGVASVDEVFDQSVYQFASTHGASVFYNQLNAKYRSCRSVTEPDGNGGTLRVTVHSQSKRLVGGHQAVQIVAYFSDSKLKGVLVKFDVLWTMAGADIYMIDTTLLNTASPHPTQSSLTLKLIARVRALR